MNINIRKVRGGYLIRIRRGVPPLFISLRADAIRYIENMWECAIL